jgi:hypothetical protein
MVIRMIIISDSADVMVILAFETAHGATYAFV